jgi:hypothetical protein
VNRKGKEGKRRDWEDREIGWRRSSDLVLKKIKKKRKN